MLAQAMERLVTAANAASVYAAAIQSWEWRQWLAKAADAIVFLLGISDAHAQRNCPVISCRAGGILPEGCTCTSDKDLRLPPPLPPPPGCDPDEIVKKLQSPTGIFDVFSSLPKCQITPEQCEALPNMQTVTAADGSMSCAPEKCEGSYKAFGFTFKENCKRLPIVPKNSKDPNIKIGPDGFSDRQFRADGGVLTYVISFENLPAATASAQIVAITDQLDVAKLDLDTVSLGPFALSDLSLAPGSGIQQFNGAIDLRPEQNLIVTMRGALNKSTGLLTWLFTSVDPATGQLTEDIDAGFLPPNTSPPAGEGSVAFSVQAKKGLASGTEICNQASIVFDANAPIATPRWCNTIDSIPPASQVAALPATQSSATFTVSWAGTDADSGIADYSIHVSENGGAFAPFATETTATSLAFTGVMGRRYAFYSVARDHAGNVESKPSTADATTWVGSVAGFTDVPSGYWAEDYIYALYFHVPPVTNGCEVSPLRYCPVRGVTREQMAAFIVRALEGEPPDTICSGGSGFADVAPGSSFCKYIKRLAALGITKGCSAVNFCPATEVTREQMAAFLIRALEGEPADNTCALGSRFADVNQASAFCKYIERLAARNVTLGCTAENFCPSVVVLRDQMAVFLGRAFLGLQ
jgi:hypothetical protein